MCSMIYWTFIDNTVYKKILRGTSMSKLIIATRNQGKLIEIKSILKSFPLDVVSMEEDGILLDVEETGTTFDENSFKKAKEIFDLTNSIVMADDSGLEVDFLNGAPGVYTARFAGENATNEQKISKLLGLMAEVPFEQRTARFVCSITVYYQTNKYFTVSGFCEGLITTAPVGSNGFGYDPIFYIPQFQKTLAELPQDQKNEISHRGKALHLMTDKLSEIIKSILL